MKKRKRKWSLLEGLGELVLTLLCLGIGEFIVSLFGVDLASPSIDYDLLILLGFIIFFIIFAMICALVQWIKKIFGRKRNFNENRRTH